MILTATLATAAACAVLNIWMAVRIGQIRGARKIWIGDGDDPQMVARMRAQANFVEYAPFVLILLALLELARGTSPLIWGYGLAFVLARILHVFGMDGWKPGRMAGAIVTLLLLLVLAGHGAWVAFTAPVATGPVIVDIAPRG